MATSISHIPGATERGNAAILRSAFIQLSLALTYCHLFECADGVSEAYWFRERAHCAMAGALSASLLTVMRRTERADFTEKSAELRMKLKAADESWLKHNGQRRAWSQ